MTASGPLRGIVASSIRFRLLVAIAAAGIIAVGLTSIRSMPVDVYPEYTAPTVEIQTEALGLSASEVEQLITVPLESDVLNGVAWLDKIHSESIPGLSSITLVFEPGTDLLRARQMVQERLSQPAAIPNVSKAPVMLPPVSSTSRTMMIGLSSDTVSLTNIGVLARWTIRPRLMGVQGVANVAIWGGRDRQLQVQVDPRHLKARGVSLDQVISTAGNSLWVSSLSFLEASTPGTGGFFDAPNQRLAVRHVSPIVTPADLAGVPVEPAGEGRAPKKANGSPLRLGDVAHVVEGHQPLIGDAIVNGKPGLMLVIERLPTANTLEVTDGVDAALAALKPGLAGIDIDNSVFRPATFIRKQIHGLGFTLLVGFALLMIALLLLFYRPRAALVVVVAILSSVLAAVLVIHLNGATMNTLTFAGLAIGLGVIIDDAIVGAQRVVRSLWRKRQNGEVPSVAASVLEATVQARSGLVFATIIILLPLLPVLFLNGLGRAFGRPMALSYILALAVSIVVAMTVTPALAVIALSKAPRARHGSNVMASLERRYDRILSRFIRSARPAAVLLCLLVIGGLVAAPFVQRSPVPTFKETDFVIGMDGAPGTSLPEMSRVMTRAARELRATPGVRNVGATLGRAVTGDEVVSPNSGQLWVSVDQSADYDRTVASIKQIVRGYPGIDTDLKTYAESKFANAGSGADEPVVVRVFGQDLTVLSKQVGKIEAALAGVKGLVGLHSEVPRQEPALVVEPKLTGVKAAGIRPGDVRRAAATLISGIQVGSLFQEQKVFDVVVWGTPATRENVSAIRDLLIDVPGGGRVRLGDVATIAVKSTPDVIEHDSVSRRVDVTAGVRGRDPNAVLADVRSRLKNVDFPLEYHYELIGNYAEQHALGSRLVLVGIIVALGIFLLLQATFGSWRIAALLFVTLPVALVGCVAAILIGGQTLELGSLVGLLAVFGIAVRNSIALIKGFQHFEGGSGLSGAGSVMRGARERMTPILITATSTAMMVLPFVFLGKVAGYEIVRPMGGVILGGLVTSTLLNLFILPALYLRFCSGKADVHELDLRELWEPERSGTETMSAASAS